MFNDLITRHFQYLIDDYGFAITYTRNDIVEYVAEHCRVLVSVDRGYVGVELRSNEPQIIRRLRCTLWDVLFLKQPGYQIEHGYDPHAFPVDRFGTVERQLREQAELLRRFCDELLRGDFSRRAEIEQFRRQAEEEFWSRFPRLQG
jgi:hypothetical protein